MDEDTFQERASYSPNSPADSGPKLIRSQQYNTALRNDRPGAGPPKPLFPKKKPYHGLCSRTKILIASAVLVIILLLIVVLPLALTLGGITKVKPTMAPKSQNQTQEEGPMLSARLKMEIEPHVNSTNPGQTFEEYLIEMMEMMKQQNSSMTKPPSNQTITPISRVKRQIILSNATKSPDLTAKSIENMLKAVDEDEIAKDEKELNQEFSAVLGDGYEEEMDSGGEIMEHEVTSFETVNEMIEYKLTKMLLEIVPELDICTVFDCGSVTFKDVIIVGNSLEGDFSLDLLPHDNESPIIEVDRNEVIEAEKMLLLNLTQHFTMQFPKFVVPSMNLSLNVDELCDEDKFKYVVCRNVTTTTIFTTSTTQSTTTPTTTMSTPPPTYAPTTPPIPSVINCYGQGFKCTTSGEEVSLQQVCDGREDCVDGSDENRCQASDCKTNFFCPPVNATSFFKCLRGKVICDTTKDCENGLDEQLYCKSECMLTDEFKCAGADICLPRSFMCDGDPQCPNEDDEINCTERQCMKGARWCEADKRCIASWQWCDGTQHCSDGADEIECTCSSCHGNHAVLCQDDGQCINTAQLCDSVNDCPLKQDEATCPGFCEPEKALETMVCTDGKRYPKSIACSGLVKVCQVNCAGQCDLGVAYMCNNSKKCIPKRQLCDRNPDCEDGSDESPEMCSCSNPGVYRCKADVKSNSAEVTDKCIPDSRRCDGYADCPAGEDENDCTDCRNNDEAWLCRANNRCLPKFAKCNGMVDCPDYSDEDFCSCAECKSQPYETFLCQGSSRCLKKVLMCKNGAYKCPGNLPGDTLIASCANV